jgi:outer membrane protein assembly factor BamB
LYALDATTGAPVNSVCVDSRAVPDDQRCRAGGTEVEIESSPAIVPEDDGSTSVVVGMDVHNDRGKGRAGVIKFALTASGLTTRWKFDPDARRTVGLTDDPQGGSGCADVWGSPAVDVKGDRVFFGTGSCDSGPDALTTGEHVWAVALGDGGYVWDYGAHDADTGTVDDDFGGALNLLPGNLVGAGNKDGAYYELARDDGHLVHKVQVGQPGHLSDGFAVGGILASAAVGEVNGKPAVFTATAISTPNDKPLQDGPDTAPPSALQDPQRMFSLAAIDVETGAIIWRSPVARQAYGPPTYANGVVLVPCTFDLQIDAFDANTGLPLAARPVTGPPSSAPTAIGDSVYGGVGTSTGEGSPLAPLGGVYGMQVSGL